MRCEEVSEPAGPPSRSPGRARAMPGGRRCGSGRGAAARRVPARGVVSTHRAGLRVEARPRGVVRRWCPAAGGRRRSRRCRWSRRGAEALPPTRAGARRRRVEGAGRGDRSLLPAPWGRSRSQAAVRAGSAPARTRHYRKPRPHGGAAGAVPEPPGAVSRRRRPGRRGTAARADRRWPTPAGRGSVPGSRRRRRSPRTAPGSRWAPAPGGPGRGTAAARWRIRVRHWAIAAGARGQRMAPARCRSRSIRCRSAAGAGPRCPGEASDGMGAPRRLASSSPAGTGHRRSGGDGRVEPEARTSPRGRLPEEPPESRRRRSGAPRMPRVPSGRAGPVAGSRARRCRQAVALPYHLASGGPLAP